MTIRAFVAELIWLDNLELITYFKANNCYMSLRIFCLPIERKKNYFIANYITEKCIFKKVFCLKYLKRIDIYILHNLKTMIEYIEERTVPLEARFLCQILAV